MTPALRSQLVLWWIVYTNRGLASFLRSTVYASRQSALASLRMTVLSAAACTKPKQQLNRKVTIPSLNIKEMISLY